MKHIINNIKAFFSDKEGGEVAEWAVVVAILVAIAVFAYGPNLQAAIAAVVTTIQNAVTNAA